MAKYHGRHTRKLHSHLLLTSIRACFLCSGKATLLTQRQGLPF